MNEVEKSIRCHHRIESLCRVLEIAIILSVPVLLGSGFIGFEQSVVILLTIVALELLDDV